MSQATTTYMLGDRQVAVSAYGAMQLAGLACLARQR